MIGGKVNDEMFAVVATREGMDRLKNDEKWEEIRVVYSEEFERAFEELIGLEGRYSNDKDDPGGETMFGISRRSHPDWAGWDDIDAYKKHELLTEDWDFGKLTACAKELYHDKYWKRVHGNNVPPERYAFALECFESCVNVGPKQFTKWLQTAANCFVGEGHDIQVDGAYGNQTKALVFKLLEEEQRGKMLVLALNIQQGSHYIHLVTQRPKLRKYIMGWLGKRVVI